MSVAERVSFTLKWDEKILQPVYTHTARKQLNAASEEKPMRKTEENVVNTEKKRTLFQNAAMTAAALLIAASLWCVPGTVYAAEKEPGAAIQETAEESETSEDMVQVNEETEENKLLEEEEPVPAEDDATPEEKIEKKEEDAGGSNTFPANSGEETKEEYTTPEKLPEEEHESNVPSAETVPDNKVKTFETANDTDEEKESEAAEKTQEEDLKETETAECMSEQEEPEQVHGEEPLPEDKADQEKTEETASEETGDIIVKETKESVIKETEPYERASGKGKAAENMVTEYSVCTEKNVTPGKPDAKSCVEKTAVRTVVTQQSPPGYAAKKAVKKKTVKKAAAKKASKKKKTASKKRKTASEKKKTKTGMKLEAVAFRGKIMGDAQMLSCGGDRLMIDTLAPDSWKELRKWLKQHKYKKFDVYISHYHIDHMGNLMNLMNDKSFRIRTLYLPDMKYMTGGSKYMKGCIGRCNEIVKTAKKKGIKIVYLKKDSSFRIGDVKAKVLWGTDYKNKEHDKKYINNNSLVTKFISEDMTYLNAGDIEKEAERQILKAKVNLRADVFKMNHHGVDTSNTDAFLKAVGASYYYYNYRLDNTKRFSPSGTWAYRPVTDAQKYGNVTSLMYNGGREKTRTITYSVKNGVLTQDIRSNISRKKVYLYDRKKKTKLKRIVMLEVCNIARYRLKTRMFRGYRYSKTKKTIKNNTASVKSTKKVLGNAVKTKCGLRRAASWKLNKKIKITKYIAEKTAEKRSRIPQRAKNA